MNLQLKGCPRCRGALLDAGQELSCIACGFAGPTRSPNAVDQLPDAKAFMAWQLRDMDQLPALGKYDHQLRYPMLPSGQLQLWTEDLQPLEDRPARFFRMRREANARHRAGKRTQAAA